MKSKLILLALAEHRGGHGYFILAVLEDVKAERR